MTSFPSEVDVSLRGNVHAAHHLHTCDDEAWCTLIDGSVEDVLSRDLSRAETPYAHTPSEEGGGWHLWVDHARSVSDLASEFGAPFGAGPLCRLIGLTHDAGKLTEDVQRALQLRALDHGSRLGVPHKWEGAALATLLLEAGNMPAAQVMQLASFGHHNRIPNRAELVGMLRFTKKNPGRLDDLIQMIQAQTNTDLRELAATVRLPQWIESTTDLELFARMCHSALVDADFLDTEAHFKGLPQPRQAHQHGMESLRSTFESAYARKFSSSLSTATSELNRLRRTCFDQSRLIGAQAPTQKAAIYRLPAPTGCGKTMSSAEFALTHAAKFGKRRVVVAVPFTSITTQNAQVYREMFKELGDEVVLEHHSNILNEEIADSEWRRFSASNWDAEFIVTTTVQLLESLFSNRPSATRKLHRLVDSVVVIDEVQALPIDLLPAILRMLEELGTNLGVTFLLASATQPAFWSLTEWKDLEMKDLMPVHETPTITQRVRYDVRRGAQTWDEIAAEVSTETQALAVVNTTADAQRLHALLSGLAAPDQPVLHLSTRMYNGHRARVLDEVKELLTANEPVLLVSTQLIEAGVDIDFPAVYRALAPADSIVQSAGRCNREGNLGIGGGRVVVFQSVDGGGPSGAYTRATSATRQLFIEQAARATQRGEEPHRLGDPASMEVYYQRLYAERLNGSGGTVGAKVNGFRNNLSFEDTHDAFRMIEETTVAVIVDDHSDSSGRLEGLIGNLQQPNYFVSRADRRLLNRFTASVRQWQVQKQPGLFEQLGAGPLLWTGEYDARTGLMLETSGGMTIL